MKNFLKPKTFIIGAIVIVIIGGGIFAVSQFAHHRHYVVSGIVHKLNDELNLSDAQERQIEAALSDAVRQFRAGRESRLESAAALIKQPQLTADEVRRAMDAHTADSRRAAREAVIADTLVKVHAILTPQQRAELAAVIQDKMDDDWWHGRHHRGRHFGHRWLH